MSATTQVYCLTLYVTYQQEVAIRELFTVKGWTFTKKGDENESPATQDESHVDTGLNCDGDNNDNDEASATEGEGNIEDHIAVMKEAVKSVTENTDNIETDNPNNDDNDYAEVKTELDAVTDYDDGDDDDDLTSDLDYNDDDESDDNNEEDSDEYLPDSETSKSGRKRKVTAPKTRSKKLKSEKKGKKGAKVKTKLKTYGDKTATARRKAQKDSTSSSKSVKLAELNESPEKDEIINFDADLDVDSERLNIELELQESDDIDHYETVLKSLSPDEPFNPPTDVQESDGFSESLGCYYCHDCGYTFQLQRWYDTHRWKGRCVYRCPVCSERFTFRNISLYRTHMTAHKEEAKVPSQSEKEKKKNSEDTSKTYKCTQCDYRTTSANTLKQHAFRFKHPQLNHTCPVCRQRFKYKGDLEAHTAALHPEAVTEASYFCPQCDYKTSVQRYLTKHLGRHLPQKYECSHCLKKFAQQCQLNTHVKYTHQKFRKHFCNSCQRFFKSPHVLKEHMQTHSNFVYLDCPLCKTKFRFKSRLQLHLINDHEQTFKKD